MVRKFEFSSIRCGGHSPVRVGALAHCTCELLLISLFGNGWASPIHHTGLGRCLLGLHSLQAWAIVLSPLFGLAGPSDVPRIASACRATSHHRCLLNVRYTWFTFRMHVSFDMLGCHSNNMLAIARGLGDRYLLGCLCMRLGYCWHGSLDRFGLSRLCPCNL